jgi:hypothetical protein
MRERGKHDETNIEPSTLKKESRHISVLGLTTLETKQKPTKRFSIHLFVFVFLLIQFMGVLEDLSVYLINVPALNQLHISTGTITFYIRLPHRAGNPVILANYDETTVFNCEISSSMQHDCIEKDKLIFFENKNGKVWWYEKGIKGFFSNNILLQLEVDGKTVIDYETQKQKYLHHKNSYLYVNTVIFLTILLSS